MRLSNDGGYVDEDWSSYQLTTTWTLSTYGSYVMPRYVYAWFRDAESSVYGPYFDDIVYDPVAPEGGVEILGSEFVTVTLRLEATDDNSGVALMRVGHEVDLTDVTWQPYADTLEWVLEEPVVYAQFQDRAGNLSPLYSSETGDTSYFFYLPIVQRNY